jgi:phage terminase small subunit
MPKKAGDLSPKEQVFIREYLKDGKGTRAVIAAGWSAKTASVTASKLLRKPNVAEELANLRGKLLDKLEISAERVLQGLGELAFFDPRKMFNEDGSLKKITELDGMTVRALTGFSIEKLFQHYGKGLSAEIGTVTKIRFTDRGLNLERLGRHHKLFTDKIEVSDSSAIIAKLKAGRARVAERLATKKKA